MTTYSKTLEASKLLNKLEDIRSTSKLLWWKEARIWYLLKKKSLYKYAYGTDIEEREMAWRNFVAETDTPLSTADYKERCYRIYLIEFGFPEEELLGINPRKLQEAIPHINKDNCREIVDYAKTMSKSDFKGWLRETYV